MRIPRTNLPTKGKHDAAHSILRVPKLKQVIIIHMLSERQAENEMRLAQMSRVYPTPGVNLAKPTKPTHRCREDSNDPHSPILTDRLHGPLPKHTEHGRSSAALVMSKLQFCCLHCSLTCGNR